MMERSLGIVLLLVGAAGTVIAALANAMAMKWVPFPGRRARGGTSTGGPQTTQPSH